MATNVSILTGRLTADPKINGTDKKTARFTLAVKRNYKNKEGKYDSDFISCVALQSALVENIVEPYLKQGTLITVTGRIVTGNYTKQDGTKVYTTDVAVNDIDLSVGGSAGNGGAQGQAPAAAPAQAPAAAPMQDASQVGQGFMPADGYPDDLTDLLPD